MMPTILIVEDDDSARLGLRGYLSGDYELREAATLAAARDATSGERLDAVLLDLNLPDGDGLDWIPELRESDPRVAIVVATGVGEVRTAVEAMRRGADNFLTKPIDMEELDVFLKRSIEMGGLRRREEARRRLSKETTFCFGESRAMRRVREMATVAAENDAAVLLQGETGTGKGMLARWIHERSARADAAFVEVNCSSLAGDLLSSELFGHAKGAFTSAARDREGLVEVADRGTLFLDEIGDMDIAVQAKFLKFIEEKRYRRLGEVKVRSSEFRLICATNQDLPARIADGAFRRDLYFRINVFPVELPPLGRRPEDMPELASRLLGELGHRDLSWDEGVRELLASYAWPGNVRELRNVLERAALLAGGRDLTAKDFPGLAGPGGVAGDDDQPLDLDRAEAATIERALVHFDGDVIRAAEALGMSKSTIYRKIKRHGLRGGRQR